MVFSKEETLIYGIKLSSVGPGRVTGQDAVHEPTHMDIAMKLHYLRAVYYFKSEAVEGLTITRLKEPMFTWLNQFPVASGRFRRLDVGSGRPYIKCNDCGVRFIEAQCVKTLDEWMEMMEEGEYGSSSLHKLLVSNQVIGPDLHFSPLVLLQMASSSNATSTTRTDQKFLTFGSITLRVFPEQSRSKFRYLIQNISEEQKCLLDNLWDSHKDVPRFLACLNALNIFFNQQNGSNPTKRFSFYCVAVGRVPGIYSYWPEVLKQIDGIPSSTWKGFHTFAEANQWAHRLIGNNFYISESSRKLNTQAALETAGFENNHAFNQPFSQQIKFCNHCETMTRSFKILNERNQNIEQVNQQLINNQRRLEDEITTLKKKLLISEKELKKIKDPFTPILKKRKQSSSLEDEEKSEWSKIYGPTELLQPKATTFLSKFPPDVIHHIQHLARQDRVHFQEFLFSELIKINQHARCIPGLTISWKTLYLQDKDIFPCPKIKPTCIQRPLERIACTCQLIYSIPMANIDMKYFEPFHLNFKGKEIEITEATLLDFGHIQQIIFHDPEDTNRFGRKIAACVLNSMADQGTSVEAVVESKFPEWTPTGQLIPAYHNIHINTNPANLILRRIFHCENDDPWICETNSIRKQIRHATAFAIAEGFHYDDLYTYGKAPLICEDLFQKIRSHDHIPELKFQFETGYDNLVRYYLHQKNQEDIMMRGGNPNDLSGSSQNYEDDEDYDFDEEAIQNINNAMEG